MQSFVTGLETKVELRNVTECGSGNLRESHRNCLSNKAKIIEKINSSVFNPRGSGET